LAEARDLCARAKKLLSKEIDPKEHRDENHRKEALAQNNSLEHIAGLWLEVKKSKVTANHAADTWRSLELHIFPKLGKTPIHKITALKTIEVIKPIAAKGSLETVKRLRPTFHFSVLYRS